VATRIADGSTRVVGTVENVHGMSGLVAVDARALYYVREDEATALFAMSKTSGEIARVVTSAPVPSYDAVADDRHIYWAAQATPPRRLMRVEKATGLTEELFVDDWLGPAVSVDACNVYFSAGSPPMVWARGK
jgi:hypothetical protein